MSGKQAAGEAVAKQPAAQSTARRFMELIFMLFFALLGLFSWDAAKKANEENSLLRSELRRAKTEAGDSGDRSGTRCTVCLENPREILYQDCGHVCACSDCTTRIRTTDNRCPVCRRDIASIKSIFIS